MGSYKWSYKSPNMGYNCSYPTLKPRLYLPMNLQVLDRGLRAEGFGRRFLGFRVLGLGLSGLGFVVFGFRV